MTSSMHTTVLCCSRAACMLRPILASSLWAIMPTLHPTYSSPCCTCQSPCIDRTSFMIFFAINHIDCIEYSIMCCLFSINHPLDHESMLWYPLLQMFFYSKQPELPSLS